jgi:hypothetical protein|tara:strand:+ start:361 stop:612 length:252 start_codon:yes stop_codon:yes gene_type:complete
VLISLLIPTFTQRAKRKHFDFLLVGGQSPFHYWSNRIKSSGGHNPQALSALVKGSYMFTRSRKDTAASIHAARNNRTDRQESI